MVEIKMPRGAKDLRIRHFKSLSHLPEEGIGGDNILFLSAFTGLRYNQMLDFNVKDIRKMTNLAVKAIARMDLTSKLPEELKLNGSVFKLVNPDTVGIGWHIDFASCNIERDPVRMACLFYLPEGFNYSDVDENGNITHPIASRYELFENEFPLELFVRCTSFFLRKSLQSTKRSMVQKIAETKTKKKIKIAFQALRHLFGSKRLKL